MITARNKALPIRRQLYVMNASVHETVTVYEIPGGMIPDRMLRIQGTIPPGTQGFQVYLQNGPDIGGGDIMFNMNFQLANNEPKLIMNHKENNKWGKEETKTNVPIIPGEALEVLLLCDKEDFKIAVNGKPVCEFRHRLPIHKITHIVTENQIAVSSVGIADPT